MQATLSSANDYATHSGGAGSDAAVAATSPFAVFNQATFVASGTHAGVTVKFWLKTRSGTWVNVGTLNNGSLAVEPAGAVAIATNGSGVWSVRFPLGTYIDSKITLEGIDSGALVVELDAGKADPADIPPIRQVSIAATPQTITSSDASALAVGANGATNPVLKINAATASVATGLQITGAAAAGGVAVAAISSGTNENLTINAKGSGTITIGGTSTGNVNLGGGGGRVVLPGTLTAGGLLTCALQVATSGPLIYSGSGAPTISAAVKGSLYLRTDGSGTGNRVYIATDTSGTWTACTTAA